MNLSPRLSKYNIYSRLPGSDQAAIVNLLSGEADILTPELAAEYEAQSFSDPSIWLRKGYLADPDDEARRFRLKYLDFLDQRDREEIQLFFAVSYACNFACSYCYQHPYAPPPGELSRETIHGFYSYVDHAFRGRSKYITLFGGEPLMEGEKARKGIAGLLEGATKRGLDVAVVTNGYYLKDYLDLLAEGRIREIQTTLDGTEAAHDGRRFLAAGGGPTFRRIVEGIDEALDRGFPVNLRFVADRDNLRELPDLARFAMACGWTANRLFKTQVGRNYELHCSGGSQVLYSRLELYRELYHIIREYPHILEFHRPAFSAARFLFENGRLPEPLFDACPGCKSEWAFDYSGRIYACTATVGKQGEELGMFYPEAVLDEGLVEQWRDRDILGIAECRDCSLALACGGGCGAVAKNRSGRLASPDCRPVGELIPLGVSLYFPG